jgi:hypothetical protein
VSSAIRSVLAAALLGTGVMGLVLWGVRTIQPPVSPGSTPDAASPAANLLFGGSLAAPVVAGAAAWHLLREIPSIYRRGALTLVAAFATPVLSLFAAPVDYAFGRAGLVLFTLLSAGLALFLAGRPKPSPS